MKLDINIVSMQEKGTESYREVRVKDIIVFVLN